MSGVVTWVRAQWDRTGGFALLAVGAALLLSGWVGVSGTSDGAQQLSYLVSGGLGGLFCLGVGATLLLSADLTDEWRKLDELTRALRQHHQPTVVTGDTPGPPGAKPPLARRPVLGAVAGAALLLGAGWFWASGAGSEDGAIPGLLLGLTGLLAAVLVQGAALWRARRVFDRGKALVIQDVSSRWPGRHRRLEADVPRQRVTAEPLGPHTVLTVAGLRRFHRPGCPTMLDVDATPVARDRVSPDLLPCQLCEAE